MHIGYTGATFDPVDEVKVRGFNAEFFLQTVDQMIEEIHQVPPAAGGDRVLVPGEPEQQREERYLEDGLLHVH
ncbi:hypothetical protein NZD89_03410 [Alicyclobacillus fastidiosus]|uniref:Uncharacterized protein n=1 Tax=Alicyclobacillus fastidiosus TaxID=392011 RepID=A0ABY6ZIF4_9BACL|nr:hypothetical protein [Alicyclobacillus fastidiosus]WAH42550.1 hypothetical protein NZD89_03410 [Alicyclobacillus fastidiosus]